MRLYESVIIFDPQLKAPEIEEIVKKFTNFVANHGGEIVTKEDWGKRRLAYEINRKQYGYYVLLRFHGQGQLVTLLEREYKLNEMVLRYLTIQVEKKALQMEQQLASQAAAEAEAEKAEAAAQIEKEKEKAAPSTTEASEQPAEDENEPESTEAETEVAESSEDEKKSE